MDKDSGMGISSIEKLTSSSEVSNSYAASIGVANLVSFIGWIAVMGGISLTFVLVKESGMALMGIPSAVTVALVGLILVISGQASRAVFDNANYSKHMLHEMRKNKGKE